MAKVTVSVVTVQASLPSGSVVGAFRLSLLDANGAVVQTQDSATPQAVFSGVADGDYVVSVARLDGNGSNIAEPVTASVHVAVQPVVYDAPASLSVTVEAE